MEKKVIKKPIEYKYVGGKPLPQTPKKITEPESSKPTNPATLKKIKYRFAGKESFLEILSKSLPKEMKPTKKTGYAFGGIFLIVVVIALLQFPLDSMLAGNINISMKVGLPMTFLEFSLIDPSKPPARIWGLIVDLLIYLLIAYSIDVIINLVMNNRLLESEEEKKKRPKIFKNKEQPKNIIAKSSSSKIKNPQPQNPNNLYKPNPKI